MCGVCGARKGRGEVKPSSLTSSDKPPDWLSPFLMALFVEVDTSNEYLN